MELGSRIDNQLFAIFITLMSDSGTCSRMILCCATATPRLYSSEMPLELFFSSYLSTYVERDVAGYLNVRNVTAFHKFLRLCALSGALWRLAWNQVFKPKTSRYIPPQTG